MYARHIFYDLMDNMVQKLEVDKASTGAQAVAALSAACLSEHEFHFYSDLNTTAEEVKFENINPVEALLGEEGLAEKYGGELVRDWWDVYLVNRVGRDSGVQVREGKNLLGVTYDVDATNVVTRIMPTGQDADGNILYLPERYVDSPRLGDYPHAKWMHLDVSEAREVKSGEGKKTMAQCLDAMRKAAQEAFDAGCDLPDVTLKVDFLNCASTEEYKDYDALQEIFLGDAVQVAAPRIGVSVFMRMTQYTYDCLQRKYTAITLGMATTTVESSMISARQLPNGIITGSKLAMNSVGAGQLQSGSVGALQIQMAAIDTAHIKDAAITNAKIGKAAIDTANIKDAAITNAKIGKAAIDTANIQDAAITNAKIGAAAIDTANIKDLAVTNAKIAKLAVGTVNIQDAAIKSAKIDKAAIGEAHIQDASISTAKIQDAAITRAKIVKLAVGSAQIEDLAVTTAKIAQAAITNAQIANAAVGTAQIALGAITAALIEKGAVGEAQIADASITAAKIVSLNADVITSGTLATERLIIKGDDGLIYEINAQASGLSLKELEDEKFKQQLNGTVIVARSITAAQIAAATITANEILAGTITGDKIAAGTITGSNIKAGTLTTSHVTSDFGEKLVLDSNAGIKLIVQNTAAAQNTANEAKNKADTLTQTVQEQKTAIDQNAKDIALRATKTEVSTAKTEAISAAASDAATKANSALNSAKTYTDAQLKVSSEEIASTVEARYNLLSGGRTNYAMLRENTASYWGFHLGSTVPAEGRWLYADAPARDIYISEWYECKGGETFQISFDIFGSLYGAPSSGGTDRVRTGTALSIFTRDGSKANYGFLLGPRYTREDYVAESLSGTLTLPANAREFAVVLQSDGIPPFSGDLVVRNILVEKISDRLLSAESRITQNASAIAGKAEQTSVNGLSTRVSSVEAGLNAANAAITLKVSTTDFQNGLNSLQIGGRNLLRLSGHWSMLPADYWKSNGGGMTLDTSVEYQGHNTLRTVVGSGISYNYWVELVVGQVYTYSATVRSDRTFTGSHLLPLHFWTNDDQSTVLNDVEPIDYQQSITTANTWTKLYTTFRAKHKYFCPFLYSNTFSATLNVAYVKLEEGTRATDWTPAPEDPARTVKTTTVTIDENGMDVSTGGTVNFHTNAFHVTPPDGADQLFSVSAPDRTVRAQRGYFDGGLYAPNMAARAKSSYVTVYVGGSGDYPTLQAAWDSLPDVCGEVRINVRGNAPGEAMLKGKQISFLDIRSTSTTKWDVGNVWMWGIHATFINLTLSNHGTNGSDACRMYAGQCSFENVTFASPSRGLLLFNGAMAFLRDCKISGIDSVDKIQGYGVEVYASFLAARNCTGTATSGGLELYMGAVAALTGTFFGPTINAGAGTVIGNYTLDGSTVAKPPVATSKTYTSKACISWMSTSGSRWREVSGSSGQKVESRNSTTSSGFDYRCGWWVLDTGTAIKTDLAGKTITKATLTITRIDIYGDTRTCDLAYHKVTDTKMAGYSGSIASYTPRGNQLFSLGTFNLAPSAPTVITLPSSVYPLLQNGTIKGFGLLNNSTHYKTIMCDSSCTLTVNYQ